eukprot:9470589-Pyramimonas_sp.AAC.1
MDGCQGPMHVFKVVGLGFKRKSMRVLYGVVGVRDETLRRAVAHHNGKNWKKIGAIPCRQGYKIPLSRTRQMLPRETGLFHFFVRSMPSHLCCTTHVANGASRPMNCEPRVWCRVSGPVSNHINKPDMIVFFSLCLDYNDSGIFPRPHGRSVLAPLAEGVESCTREGAMDYGGRFHVLDSEGG